MDTDERIQYENEVRIRIDAEYPSMGVLDRHALITTHMEEWDRTHSEEYQELMKEYDNFMRKGLYLEAATLIIMADMIQDYKAQRTS